jgi:hypothetical protein
MSVQHSSVVYYACKCRLCQDKTEVLDLLEDYADGSSSVGKRRKLVADPSQLEYLREQQSIQEKARCVNDLNDFSVQFKKVIKEVILRVVH